MEALATRYGLGGDGSHRRVRCFGHILNLAVKAFIFGNGQDKFDNDIPDCQVFEEEAVKGNDDLGMQLPWTI